MEKEYSVRQAVSGRLIYYLRSNGYGAVSLNTSGKEGNWDTEKICVTREGRNVCDINCVDGTITYQNASDREEIESIRDIINDLQEQERIFIRADPMQAEGLKHYKVLAEYNSVVLAACESESINSSMQRVNSYQYVTWEKDNGGLGVHSGNYFSDNYTGAKENFVIRAEMVRKDKLFSETEMMAVYSGLVKLEGIEDTAYDSYKIYEQIKSKIRNIVPHIEEKVYRNDPRYEENSSDTSIDDSVTINEEQDGYEQEIR